MDPEFVRSEVARGRAGGPELASFYLFTRHIGVFMFRIRFLYEPLVRFDGVLQSLPQRNLSPQSPKPLKPQGPKAETPRPPSPNPQTLP